MATIDSRIISQLLGVSTPNLSDALDRLGIEGAPQKILPIYPCAKIAGPAATLKIVPDGKAKESPAVNCYGGVAGATSKHHGLVGCVCDGVVRDVDEYKGYGMPVYGKGIAQQSVRGRSSCAGYGIEVALSGVRVRPGDYIVADDNGTIVIPAESITEVVEFAQKVKATEERIIAQVRAGMDPVEAHEKVNYDNMLKAQSN